MAARIVARGYRRLRGGPADTGHVSTHDLVPKEARINGETIRSWPLLLVVGASGQPVVAGSAQTSGSGPAM